MDGLSTKTAMLVLAERASRLPAELLASQEACGHTGEDIKNIGEEVALVSTALKQLHEAMIQDPNLYTTSFSEDLKEISMELDVVLEEVAECCSALRECDPASGGEVSWFFKKPKTRHLKRHLRALKSTLAVMRAILQHGNEYGNEYAFLLVLLVVSLTQHSGQKLASYPNRPCWGIVPSSKASSRQIETQFLSFTTPETTETVMRGRMTTLRIRDSMCPAELLKQTVLSRVLPQERPHARLSLVEACG